MLLLAGLWVQRPVYELEQADLWAGRVPALITPTVSKSARANESTT
jgi:hypothetical protein